MAKASIFMLVFMSIVYHALGITTSISMLVTDTTPKSLVLKLIQHNSSSSANEYNVTNWADQVMKRSIARFTYLQKKIEQVSEGDSYVGNLDPAASDGVFSVKFSIGEPPLPQLAIMDTGSSVTWVKCAPCTPCNQPYVKIFNPRRSYTYANLKCNECQKCDSHGQCTYMIEYMGGQVSEGLYAKEQLTFETFDESTVKVPQIIFGCSRRVADRSSDTERINGVFALNRGRYSFVSRMGNKFSYCIGMLSDSTYKFNQLVLGDTANMQGDSTPIKMFGGCYYLDLVNIYIGGGKLDIDPSAFQRTGQGNTGVMFDSGSDHTWLAKHAYEVVSSEVDNLLRGTSTRNKNKDFWDISLCYDGQLSRDLIDFPMVTFEFSEGAQLVLDAESMFIQKSDNVFCMAVLPSNSFGDDYDSFSTIGIRAQQNYNVGYDLNEMRIYFQRIDCELLQA